MRAFPLQWPVTETKSREQPLFKQTLASSLQKLKRQVELMGGKNLVLSSNYSLGNERPKESGVCAYFLLDGQNVAIPCDRWRWVEHNVYAIALTLEAMRGMERWGAKSMITAMFSGFKALPAKAGADYHAILGLPPGEPLTESGIEAAYKRRAKVVHPDQGGTTEQWAALREAHDMLMQNVRHKP